MAVIYREMKMATQNVARERKDQWGAGSPSVLIFDVNETFSRVTSSLLFF
jgi:hypothetical protein